MLNFTIFPRDLQSSSISIKVCITSFASVTLHNFSRNSGLSAGGKKKKLLAASSGKYDLLSFRIWPSFTFPDLEKKYKEEGRSSRKWFNVPRTGEK